MSTVIMKKYKAQRDRKQAEAIVRPRIEIEDPSDELFSQSREWDHVDPLQNIFLESPKAPQPAKNYHRVPKLKVRNHKDSPAREDRSQTYDGTILSSNRDSDTSLSSNKCSSPIDIPSTTHDAGSDPVANSYLPSSRTPRAPKVPRRHPQHNGGAPLRASSLPIMSPISSFWEAQLSVSPPKTNFQLFSQRCAPSPTSTSPLPGTPLFELSADEALHSMIDVAPSDSPVELEGSPVDASSLCPAPLHLTNKQPPEPEPEASPYSRFAAFTKSMRALDANLSPIEESEEEAASRRSSAAIVYELPAVAPHMPMSPSAYSGGTSIVGRNRYTIGTLSDTVSIPARNTSTRSSNSELSTHSTHSMFSFEYSNSDTEKIYISSPTVRRESSAPSLTDVSSVDDFDIDLDLDLGVKQSKSASKRDAKLERFFGIRPVSVNAESDSSPTIESLQSPTSPWDTLLESRRGQSLRFPPSHKHTRSSLSIDDLDLSLAVENDPYRREMISIHKSILSKNQSKQDTKLEKFFGCDKDEIQVARKTSIGGSRLAGSNDDLKYRSMGW